MWNMPKSEIIIRLYHFFYPVYAAIIFILSLYMIFPDLFVKLGTILFLYLVPPAGKESMVPALVYVFSPRYGIHSTILAALFITIIDTIVAWWTVWNWDLLKYVPVLNVYVKKIDSVVKKKWERHRIMRKFAYAGLALFVAIPFQGSGGFTAALIGRLLAMNQYKIILSVALGSFGGSFLIALLAYFSLWSFKRWGIFAIGGIVILVVVIVVVYLWIRGGKNEDNGNWWSWIHRKPHR